MSIKLSILVPTIPSRINNFYLRLMNNLLNQIKSYNDIELISFFDNKKRSIGSKRDEMLKLAQGEYLVFIDDDDRISEDYIREIMFSLYNNPETDCVVFDNLTSINGGEGILCKYGIEFNHGYINDGKEWRGKPAHTMVYRSEIAKKHNFNDMKSSEDYDWVSRAWLDIKKQTRINKILYYYDANYETTSETAGLSDETIRQNINKLNFNYDIFWNEKHLNNDEYWLSSYDLNSIFRDHKLNNIKNMKVLDIGIGMGIFTRELFLLNNTVYACDISEIALNRVKDCAKTYLTSELKKIDPVDIAICNLVFQHCNDSEVERIINEVNLNENGIFSFQFAFIRENEEPNERLKQLIQNKTHYFRSLNTIIDIIKRSNKKIIEILDPIHYYDSENCSWYIVKVVNK